MEESGGIFTFAQLSERRAHTVSEFLSRLSRIELEYSNAIRKKTHLREAMQGGQYRAGDVDGWKQETIDDEDIDMVCAHTA